ncbi:hypothetical protein M9H77_30915 [Catharanthus roseus]|uniref:Uncharacterized protein n=1 Tax=Catharanthus roseus TaxID=4058 RepID=A0ACB9ZYK5_CATRO|nr:hypothetical protein M9H77_30915 [Catharanthus roseus]
MCGWKRERIALYVARLAQPVLCRTSHHALRWDGRLVESQEGHKTEVGFRADLICASRFVAWLYVAYTNNMYLESAVIMETERSYGVWLVLTTRYWNLFPMTAL